MANTYGFSYNARTGEIIDGFGRVVGNATQIAERYAREYGVPLNVARGIVEKAYATYSGTQMDPADAAKQGAAMKEALVKEFDAAKTTHSASLAQAERGRVTDQLQRYFDMLNSPVVDAQGNYTDPLAKQLVQAGANVGQQEAARRGIGGPLGSQAAAVSANTALQPYLAQRVQLAGQALQLINQRDIELEDQKQKAYALELQRVGMQNDVAAQQWAAGKNQAQGIGAAIGAGVGALGFIGGPALGAATTRGGSALGAGLGGLATGGNGPSLSVPGSYGGGSSYSGGRGNW